MHPKPRTPSEVVTTRRDSPLGRLHTEAESVSLVHGAASSHAPHGIVSVREYRCTACEGDPPQAERFGSTSIAVVRAGVFGIRTGKRTQLLSTGFALLGNAEQGYEASHEHGVGDRCLVFEFDTAALDAVIGRSRRGAKREPFASNVLPPLPRVEAFRRLAEDELALRQDPPQAPPANPRAGIAKTGLRVDEIGLSLAEYVLSCAGAGQEREIATPKDDRRSRDAVHAAIAQIESSFREPLGLGDLAATAGVDALPFLRMFKRETGTTPYRFLVQARIRRAVALLRDTSMPVTDIAFDIGFGDLSNFINTFRREMGVSPRRYRQGGILLRGTP